MVENLPAETETPADFLSTLDPRETLVIRATQMAEQYIEFAESIWNDLEEVVEKRINKNPKAFMAKMAVGPIFLSRVLPTKTHVNTENPNGKAISAADLSALGVPVETLRKLAEMRRKRIEGR